MVQTIAAQKITLYDLEQQFSLQLTNERSFFSEWQDDLSPLTTEEQQRLQRIQAIVANLERRSVLESTIKLAVIAPLLDLAGLFLPPFYVSTEEVVNLEAQDGATIVRGRIDILVLKEQLWLLIIESKRAEFSAKVGIPQALSYMLATSHQDLPLYGLVTNGTDFIFLKLVFQEVPRYARSRQFVLEQNQDLEHVLQILKRLAIAIA